MSYGRELHYETDMASNNRRRGPLRFEEGIATDTDVPQQFQQGAYGDGTDGRGGWPTKSPAETMRERYHIASSTWIDAPSLLSEFVQGAHVGDHPASYEHEMNSGARQYRPNRACVTD